MTRPESRDWMWIHGALVLVVAALFFYELRVVLSPLVLFGALVVLMLPYAGSRFHRLVILTGAVLVLLWMLRVLGTLLAPFVLAFVLAYVLDPVVDRLERLRLPRGIAIVVLALPAVAALAALALFGLPALAEQVQSLIRRSPVLIERVATWIENLGAGLVAVDLPLLDEAEVARRLRGISAADVVAFLEEQQAQITTQAWEGVLGLGRGLGTVFTILGYLVLTPVLTFYLLRDYDGIISRMGSYVPRPRANTWTGFAREYDRLLSRYLRGQVLAAAIVGILTWLGLWIAGFPYSGLVGAVAGVFNLVPFLGLVVSLVPALIIALVSGAFLANLLKIAIVFALVQFLDGNVIGPRIVGESVGLHPVWVILAVAVGAFFYGFVGLLLAVPAAILIKLAVEAGLARYRGSGVYLGRGGARA